jgi:ribokinase
VLVAVVGSANLDIVIELDSPPVPGQTVLGSGYSEHGGGKGENQAIAAARLVPTAFVGAVGQDGAGELLIENMRSHGVRVHRVVHSEKPSGRAFITLTPDAENSIAVIAGASTTLTSRQVEEALDALQPKVVVLQQEIHPDAVAQASDWAIRNGARFLLNASPVRSVDSSVLEVADPLIVNADEARDILAEQRGVAGAGLDGEAVELADTTAGQDPEQDLARQLLRVSRSVIVTAGKRGAYLTSGENGTVEHVAARIVEAVDTTGAGDEFAGTVAASLALGESLREAAERGSAASARIVQLSRAAR